MKPERWRQVKALYGQLRGLHPERIAEHLEAECAGDEELRVEVERMLAPASDKFLETPPLAGLARSATTSAPQRLGGYEIVERLGSGGFGVVYRAYDPTLDREVALKVLPMRLTLEPRDIERFEREARAIAKLRHPGIVSVHAVGCEGDTHYFAMDLVEGANLRVELDRRCGKVEGESRLPADEGDYLRTVARLIAEAADALQHAHDHGIVHRDVKPANLLLGEQGELQLVDFGLARDAELGRLTRTGEQAGTPHYMSPEQVRTSRSTVDHRTDVYSLGVVLYELLTLQPPFQGRTYLEIVSDVVRRQPTPPRRVRPGLPRDLETICTKAMEKDVAERYPDAAALRDDLKRWLQGRPIVARPWSPAERAVRWARRNRRLEFAVVAAVLALGLGALVATRMAHARSQASLDLSLFDAQGESLPGTVSVRAIDPVLGTAGPARGLGPLPLRGRRLTPGDYRLVVRPREGAAFSLTRNLRGGETLALTPPRRDELPSTEGMIRIAGGTLALRDANAPLLAINGHDLSITPFWLDACEVSNGEYREFLGATGHSAPKHWSRIEPGAHDGLPVVLVGWEDARAYAEWAGKRLPSFAEWCWAARGAEGRLYPWPDALKSEPRGNCARALESVPSDKYVDLYMRSVAPVRSHPDARTASGVFHLFGNVAEWTESPGYEPRRPLGSGFDPRPHMRLVAGHPWDAATRGHTLSTFGFEGSERTWASHRIGFRCALSAASHQP